MTHLNKADDLFTELSPKIKEDLGTAQDVIHKINDVISQAESQEGISEQIQSKLDEVSQDGDQSIEKLTIINESLEQLKNQLGEGSREKATIEQAQEEISSLIAVIQRCKINWKN